MVEKIECDVCGEKKVCLEIIKGGNFKIEYDICPACWAEWRNTWKGK